MNTKMYVLSKNILKNIYFFFLVKISIFTAEKSLCILHGRVFVMGVITHTYHQCYLLIPIHISI